jgi:hypothetical protein
VPWSAAKQSLPGLNPLGPFPRPPPSAIQAAFQAGSPIDTNQASTLLKVAGVGYSLNDLLSGLAGGIPGSSQPTQALIQALALSADDEVAPSRAAGGKAAAPAAT